MSLSRVQPKDIHMMTVMGCTIRVRLVAGSENVFTYETQEQLEADLRKWVKEYGDSEASPFLPFELRIQK